ncbi:MAG: hypothetical protein FGM61_03580 [Sediminibacterium sp.]|nr:hypothetical protein [Sediminibacterium sp.]
MRTYLISIVAVAQLLILLTAVALIGGCKTAKQNRGKYTAPLPALVDNRIPIDAEQVILVWHNPSDSIFQGRLMIREIKKGKWIKVLDDTIKASLGRSGIVPSAQKREGDGATPAGFYQLGRLFSYESTIDTRIPFMQVTGDDKWIDDSASPDYNTYVRGATQAKSYENLLLNSIDYKYCMVIEYNTSPVIKGKGSAIFFHITTDQYPSTAGCVAVREQDMLRILSWLDPKKKKYIGIIP